MHHAQAMTCTGDTLEARPVREQSDGGQWACQVSGHAGDLQPSSGRGRLRRREEARRRFDCVRERVKHHPPTTHGAFPSHADGLLGIAAQDGRCPFGAGVLGVI